ncbi:MAG TPA: beta-L-arabinofuranosidase domain-containing protein, partial [Bryobacteraceae bacterium]|nr:beta-L-arabinofuranosidase domain-containing protein [Bryobacteraceae bacterium]
EIPEPIVVDAVPDRYRPEAYTHLKLTGLLADRMQVNIEGRLLHVDQKAMLEPFEHRTAPSNNDRAWAGEHIGKFLDAAANAYQYTDDHRLKELMDRMVKGLIATQAPDGYLGTYTKETRWTSWDVWVHKYDLLGLIAYYRVTGDSAAYNAANRIGALLVETFGDTTGKRDIIAAGEHAGMAATSVLEPMVYLYEYTGDPRYLDFCKYIVRSWDQPNGPKVASSIESTGSVFKTANGKAYEMLSNLVGLVELYRVTGNSAYLEPAVRAWKDIRDNRLYITGTTSSDEHFKDDHVLPGDEAAHVGEACVTVTWMKLTLELLRISGDQTYADQLERTIYNQLLAAQDAKTGDVCYFTPLNGSKKPTHKITCCTSSEPRGISLIPAATWGRYGGGIAMLTYMGGHADFALKRRGLVHIISESSFPESGDVLLHIEPDHNIHFALRLRVPSWTKSFTVDFGGSHLIGTPGDYLVIDREWRKGDMLKIKIDMTVSLIDGAPTYPGQMAVQRGPQVLALESAVNPGLGPLTSASLTAGPASQLQPAEAPTQLPPTWAGDQCYSIEGQEDGRPTRLFLVPFADARNYRVWLPRSE